MDEYDDDDDDTYMYDDDDDEAENDVGDQFMGFDDGEPDDQRMSCSNRKKNYDVLNKEEMRRNMEEDIAKLSTVLSVSAAESSVLLHHNGWSVSNVTDAWIADEHKVRERGTVRGYITTSINSDGSGCLSLRCLAYKCKISVTQEIIEKLASDVDKRRYTDYLIASYVEQCRGEKKQCPAPHCEFVIQYVGEGENLDVTCACNYRFCFYCCEETHCPATCESVGKWLLKNSSELENVNYLIAFTKPCPKCKRPIEKWEGCMHMTCRCCCHEFCWLCSNAWSGHNSNACNKFKTSNDEDSKKRERAKDYMQKYIHHFERWLANKKSSEKALEDLEKVQGGSQEA